VEAFGDDRGLTREGAAPGADVSRRGVGLTIYN
jgi:hypothetical protein